MQLFEKLLTKKEAGEFISLDELTPESLRELYITEGMSDGRIAELFNVKPSKITHLRRKNGITIRNSIVDEFIDNVPLEVQKDFRNKIFADEGITKIAKAITHFAFRNGPIEDMHADKTKNITDDDMKILNKYMVNRLAHIFNLIKEDQWLELHFLVDSFDNMYGINWDDAEPDDGGMKELLLDRLESFRN